LRASGGTSFRAPGLFQTISTTFTLDNIADPVVGGGASFQAVRTVGEPDLVPEEAVAYNTGFTLQPTRDVQISLDYWSFDFEDIIVKQNSQLVVNAAAAGDATAQSQVTRDPVTNRITSITTFFFNASSVKTDGVDLAASYSFDTPLGEFSLASDWTRILSYKLKATDTSAEIEGAGRRNFLTFANPAPELRGTVTVGWSIGQSTVTAIGRYIDSYINDEGTPALPAQKIDSQTTVDLQYRYEWLSSFGGGTTSFGLGVINAFDEAPPLVRTQTGYDPRVFDPRGRMVYANLKHRF
jgi:iron complex outermembrane receptor protein